MLFLRENILEKSAVIRLEGVFPPLNIHNTRNKTEPTHRAVLREENDSNKSPTRYNSFSVYYPDVCLQLNMFRAFSRPSSGAQ
jgi:hypothetical protein